MRDSRPGRLQDCLLPYPAALHGLSADVRIQSAKGVFLAGMQRIDDADIVGHPTGLDINSDGLKGERDRDEPSGAGERELKSCTSREGRPPAGPVAHRTACPAKSDILGSCRSQFRCGHPKAHMRDLIGIPVSGKSESRGRCPLPLAQHMKLRRRRLGCSPIDLQKAQENLNRRPLLDRMIFGKVSVAQSDSRPAQRALAHIKRPSNREDMGDGHEYPSRRLAGRRP